MARHLQTVLLAAAFASLFVLLRLLDAIANVQSGKPGAMVGEWVSWPVIGSVCGLAVSLLQLHPRRVFGVIPVGLFGLTLVMGLLTWLLDACPALLAASGFMIGLLAWPMLSGYFAIAGRRGWVAPVVLLGCWIVGAPLAYQAILKFLWQDDPEWVSSALLPSLFACVAVGFVLATWILFRELLELGLELLIWLPYRVRAYGPGIEKMPRHGPCILIANHSAWFDPMWLAKTLPRKLIPMMTSVFYDLPVIRWLMVHAAQAIRVQASGFRRDVPELKEAVAALDRGETLVVFPEGSMRRKEEVPLKQFGQGIWHILKERPETPVVACWIDGGWGCYFSYWNGPPTKNKKFDLWRKIEIGVAPPEVIEPSLLAEHRTLRTYLMKAVLEARRHLGREPYKLAADAEAGNGD